MQAVFIVALIAAMTNPLPAKNLEHYHAKFVKQFEHPVVEAVYKTNP
jgi:hypothetical protein